jgi:hypothetical protein
MLAVRRLTVRLLNGIVLRLPEESQNWGNAMLREVDFVESDCSALLWALGSTTALCRHSIWQQLGKYFRKSKRVAQSLKGAAKQMPAVTLGMAAAGALLAVCILALSSLMHASSFDPGLRRLADRLLVVVVPEAMYVAGAASLWRKRKSVALGILGADAILIAHAIVHFATHG